jgi:hypothetical protein
VNHPWCVPVLAVGFALSMSAVGQPAESAVLGHTCNGVHHVQHSRHSTAQLQKLAAQHQAPSKRCLDHVVQQW